MRGARDMEKGARNGKQVVVLAILFVFTLFSVGVVAIQPLRQEPLYEGRRFSEWMDDLIVGFSDSPGASWEDLARAEKSFFALHEMGDSVVPLLIPIIHKKDFKAWAWCVAELNQIPGVHIRYVSAEERARLAKSVFNGKGPKAKATLVSMLVEPDVNGRNLPQWAAAMLFFLGDDAVQPLVEAVHDGKNPELRAAAATILARFRIAEKTKFVEFTTNDANSRVVFDWYGESRIGCISSENGRQVFMTLEATLLDQNPAVRESATNTFKAFVRNNPLKKISG